MNHLVNVVDGNDQSFKEVGTLLCLLQLILGAADGHVVTMLHEILHAVLERQQARTAIDQRDGVDRETALQCCHLEELVEQYVGIGIALAVHHDAHALPARLIVDIGHALYLVFVGQVGNILHQVGLVDPVWNLRHHNLIVGLAGLDLCLGTHHDAATPSGIGILHALQAIDIGSRGEVGAGDILHQPVHVDVGVVNVGTAAINHLIEVVGRHVGGHTHGNAVAAVHQQVGNLGRHDRRLLQ